MLGIDLLYKKAAPLPSEPLPQRVRRTTGVPWYHIRVLLILPLQSESTAARTVHQSCHEGCKPFCKHQGERASDVHLARRKGTGRIQVMGP